MIVRARLPQEKDNKDKKEAEGESLVIPGWLFFTWKCSKT